MNLIQLILAAISPELRKAVVEFVISLEAKAKTTPNPLDDIVVDILKTLLGIKD